MVAVTGALVPLIAVKDAIFPEPLAARPIDGVLFTQLNVVPATGPLNVTGAVAAPLHTVWFGGTGLTVGVGFTVTVAVIGAPVHPLAVGVIVNVVVCTTLVVLVSVPLMLPVPFAAMPVKFTRLSLVHAYVVPPTAPDNTMLLSALLNILSVTMVLQLHSE
jgi:hypothetical protein